MRISDWSSDVCSSDLPREFREIGIRQARETRLRPTVEFRRLDQEAGVARQVDPGCPINPGVGSLAFRAQHRGVRDLRRRCGGIGRRRAPDGTEAQYGKCTQITQSNAHRFLRSEEHTSELQSLMRISYAVFCLKTTKITKLNTDTRRNIKSYD